MQMKIKWTVTAKKKWTVPAKKISEFGTNEIGADISSSV